MANLLYRGPTTPTAAHLTTSTINVALTIDELNQNFFGLNLDIQSRISRLGDNFTGNVGIIGTGNISLLATGDIYAYRAGGITGAIFLSNNGTRYLFNNGTMYELAGQGLSVGGNILGIGLSTSWGVTNGILTGAFNAMMGVGGNATWLLSGTSGGLFRGGLQLLDSGGALNLFVGGVAAPNLFQFTSAGALGLTTLNVTGQINIGSTTITTANLTSTEIYSNSWFRSNTALTGLYSQALANHWYCESAATWTMGSTSSATGSINFRLGHQGAFKGSVYWDTSGFGLLNNSGNWMIRGNFGVGWVGGTLYGNWDVSGALSSAAPAFGAGTKATKVYVSNDTYIRASTIPEFKTQIGGSYKNDWSRAVNCTGDLNYWTGSLGWANVWGGMDELFHGGSAFIDNWGGGVSYPPGTGHVHGFQALHYTTSAFGSTGGVAYGLQLVGQYSQPGTLWTRTCNGGIFSGWYRLLTDTGTSLASNGYLSLSNGLIIQWGQVNIANGTIVNIVFPRAFPTACLWVNMPSSATPPYVVMAVTYTTSYFTMQNASGGLVAANWMAIGY